jgi:hypothetical protein
MIHHRSILSFVSFLFVIIAGTFYHAIVTQSHHDLPGLQFKGSSQSLVIELVNMTAYAHFGLLLFLVLEYLILQIDVDLNDVPMISAYDKTK